MNFRTDLALEMHEKSSNKACLGIEVKKYKKDNIKLTEIKIKDKNGEEVIGKPVGKYITIELTEFSHESEITDHRLTLISESIKSLLPQECSSILVVGLGNENITPDALGPLCSKQILATRHLGKEM
jgi:spore protease